MDADEINETADVKLTGDRAERIRRDAERIEELGLRGFEGRHREVFEIELYREVEPIVKGMIRSGSLARLAMEFAARRGCDFIVYADDLRLFRTSSEARDTIMVEVMAYAMKKLLKDLKKGNGWSADHNGPRGASCLTSYFVTLCIWVFRRAYIRWATERVEWARLHMSYDFTEEAANAAGIGALLGTTDYVVDSEVFGTDFEEILDEQTPETQAVVRMTVMGFRATEIADKLHLTHGAVRNRLTRFRTVLYEAARQGRIWIPKELHTRKQQLQVEELAA
ncbi:hypothetical protein [Streptomyces cinereoruber]|uniref:hypothetical protein n=1 Tax=Streptomyces cinereoruber TaxID=67260 RepID=UPI00363F9815